MDDAKYILAGNLMRLMALSADMKSQPALAKRSKVAQTTIGNYLHPARYKGSPTLVNIAKLAKASASNPGSSSTPPSATAQYRQRNWPSTAGCAIASSAPKSKCLYRKGLRQRVDKAQSFA